MKSIGTYEVKTHLSRILKRVAAGETFVVTRNGEPIAQIGPVTEGHMPRNPMEVFKDMRALGLNLGSVHEIREMINEGRRL